MPLSLIQKFSHAGATVLLGGCAAIVVMPEFYHNPPPLIDIIATTYTQPDLVS